MRLKRWIYELKLRDVLVQEFIVRHANVGVLPIDIFADIDEVRTLIVLGTDKVGVFDDSGKRQAIVANVQPVC